MLKQLTIDELKDLTDRHGWWATRAACNMYAAQDVFFVDTYMPLPMAGIFSNAACAAKRHA